MLQVGERKPDLELPGVGSPAKGDDEILRDDGHGCSFVAVGDGVTADQSGLRRREYLVVGGRHAVESAVSDVALAVRDSCQSALMPAR